MSEYEKFDDSFSIDESASRSNSSSTEDKSVSSSKSRSASPVKKKNFSVSGSPPSKRRRMGDRESPKECKCLGIFGMSFYINEQTLRDMFKKYSPIDRIQIIYDHDNSRSRGFAFVSFKHIDDAVNAKKDASDMKIDGRRVRVDYSITERAHTPTPGTYMVFKRGNRGNERGKHNFHSPAKQNGGGSRYRSPSRDRY
ncbi:hypothetical protein HELRODRAFT_165508 [Helobdella robusta]|uniref:RRM domain-containing protein n=1 Tax=Helobdella robusta TaxID=6412 RepID=T1EWY0_HELRO|nr:hypothetical protein HELRODRAFT_165508 [Helobdella robusta]ESN91470.1 hypothetical protein HELRODRAFT_165508 [Helobdella robusta]